jgi:small-conductance mechanosensitive channel/CRP-like cAMP-binding protein
MVLIRAVSLVLFHWLLPLLRFSPATIVEDLVTTGAFIAWGLVWLRLGGVDLSSIVTTSAVITGVVAFSMQETLGNILGGLVLQLDKSIRVGDWVRIDDVNGRVVNVRWRYTAIETRNRETIVVPNSQLMKNRFTLIGRREDRELRWRRWIWINVDIANQPSSVCAILEKAIADAEIPNVAADPQPQCVLMDFGDRSGKYALRYWLTDPQPDDSTDSIVRAHAYAALQRAGMKLAVPFQERLIIKENEAHRAAVRADEMVRRLGYLKRVDIFRPLSEAELAALAEGLVYSPFVRGDTITRQGAVAHWLYIIVAGEADVWIETPDRERIHLTTLTSGKVFGEMGMMTGDPRRATITARTDVECYRLNKTGFEKVIRDRPDIALEISQVLASRNVELEKLRDTIRAGQPVNERHTDILERIRIFFGLNER